ncbi:MAG: protein kinase [Verrucomicrobiales bacterium]|nr:protein kinase [Verrucomicrobiales bacterium]
MTEPPAEPSFESPPSSRVTTRNSLLEGLNVNALVDAALEEAVPLPAGMDWMPPPLEEVSGLLPDYEVLELLGRGGMGAVYKCRDRNLERLVAVKLLPPELGMRSDFEQRFNREAWALAQLDHPNIVRIHGRGETVAGHLYLVMEYVEGTDLAKLLRSSRKHKAAGDHEELNFLQTLQIIQQLCGALQFAHEAGIVHRDIKPANVLISSKGIVKLADFGLARPLDGEADREQMTLTGQIFGTLDYMAPEQRDGAPGDHRVDIYALGVLLYEMITGELPRGSFEPPSHRMPVDEGVDKVVAKAMRARPDERYSAVKEMTGELSTLRDHPVPRRRWKWRRAGRWSAAVAGLGGAAALPWLMPDPQPGGLPSPRAVHPPTVVRTNFLGMPFQSISGMPSVLFSVWETRQADFGRFVADTGHQSSTCRPEYRELDAQAPNMQWNTVYFPQQPTHPVVCVSWGDAVAFCEWLTQKAEAAGEIQAGQEYRLPTDREWSEAVGLWREDGDYPWERSEQRDWFSPGSTQVVSDVENVGRGFATSDVLTGEYAFTAAVGSFPGKINGLSDLGGNAREWTCDPIHFHLRQHAARSCSFRGISEQAWRLSRRSECQFDDIGNETLGFRVVLDLKSQPGLALRLKLREAVRQYWGGDPAPGTGPQVVVNRDVVRLDLSRVGGKRDLRAFAGLPVTEFLSGSDAGGEPLDLEPLRGMPLRRVVLAGPVKSLEPLTGMVLDYLILEGRGGPAPSLAPLNRTALRGLGWRSFDGPPDVPLPSFPALRLLDLSFTRMANYECLRDLPLETVVLEGHVFAAPELLLPMTQIRAVPFYRSHLHSADKLAAEQSCEAAAKWLEPLLKSGRKLPWMRDWLEGDNVFSRPARNSSVPGYGFTSPEGKALLNWVREGRHGPFAYARNVLGTRALPLQWSMTRPDAEAFAAFLGGHLMTVTSTGEWLALCNAFERGFWKMGANGFLLGAFRKDAASPWQWPTGEAFPTDLPVDKPADLYDANLIMNGSTKGCFFRNPAQATGFVVEFEPPESRLPLHDAEEKMLGKWQWPDGSVLELGRFASVGTALFAESHWSVCDAASQTARLYLNYGATIGLLAPGSEAETLAFTPLSGPSRILRRIK